MNPDLKTILDQIDPPDDRDLERRVRQRLDSLTKPPGSLGRLEEIVIWYCLASGQALPEIPRKALYLFCADHGIAKEGVSAYPQSVTAQMALNFSSGGAAINVLCRQMGVEARVIDVGVDAALPAGLPIRNCKIARGSRNFLREAAMTAAQRDQALLVGARFAAEAADQGCGLLLAGEMGIGNTAAAAALTSALTGEPAARTVGRGAGLDEAGLRRKTALVQEALDRRQPVRGDALDALAKVGGFEIAAMAGFFLGAAARRTPAIVDGFIATGAALAAVRLKPESRDYLLFAHASAEPGHALQLQELGARPLLGLEMRLGEGTGAALAVGLADSALRLYREMATFETAGVDRESK